MRREVVRSERNYPWHKRGVALLFVLGTLAVLSIMAISFISLARLEKKISRNYVDRTRARMAAESGFETAYVRLQKIARGTIEPQHQSWMAYNPDDPSLPLRECEEPSFAVTARPPSGTIPSGIVSSNNAPNSEYYRLRVEDASGKLNLNDTDASIDPDNPDAEGRLHRLLTRLGDILFYGKLDGGLVGIKLSNLILNKRVEVGGRFHNYREIHDAVIKNRLNPKGMLDEDQYNELLRHVTLYSWRDPNVLKPNFQPRVTVPPHTAQPKENPDGSLDIYLYRDIRTRTFELEPRSPVNINTASEELISALLEPLQGWFLEEGPIETLTGTGHYGQWNFSHLYFAAFLHGYYYNSNPGGDPGLEALYRSIGLIIALNKHPEPPEFRSRHMILGRMRKTPLISDPAYIAKLIYQRVHTWGDPFESWDEFEHYIRHQIPIDYIIDARDIPNHVPQQHIDWYHSYYHDVMVDMILANFDPNSKINDFNPDRSRFRHVDKSQLCGYTTEFCFEPTGVFEISSLGIVEDPDGNLLSKQYLKAGIELFRCFRLTTQSQFLDGYETPEDLQDYFSESQGLWPTSGEWIHDNGFALQSYPEPVVPDTEFITRSIYDGSLTLANWVPSYDDAQFAVTFETGFDADITGNPLPGDRRYTGAQHWVDDSDEVYIQVDRGTPLAHGQPLVSTTWMPATRPTIAPLTFAPTAEDNGNESYVDVRTKNAALGSLYPDGAFSDIEHGLAWPAGNIGTYTDEEHKIYTGTVHFWMKPDYHPELTTRIRRVFGLNPMDKWVSFDAAHDFALYYFGNGTWNNETGNPTWRSMHPFFYGSNNGDSFLSNGSDWVPPCSFAFGFGHSKVSWDTDGNWSYQQIAAAVISETVVPDFPGKKKDSAHTHYDVLGHSWNHMAFSWLTRDFLDTKWQEAPRDNMGMSINGEPVSSNRYWSYQESNFFCDQYFRLKHEDRANYARFGAISHEAARNFSADCSYDDIFAYDHILSQRDLQAVFEDGRYYNENDAVYTSPEIDVVSALGLFRHEELILRSVSWTVTWPHWNARRKRRGGSYNAAPLQGKDANSWDIPDPYLRQSSRMWDPVSIDINLNGTDWMFSGDPETMLSYCGGSAVPPIHPTTLKRNVLLPGQKLKFQVHFNLQPLQTILESPSFDDITFMVETKTPTILFWSFTH